MNSDWILFLFGLWAHMDPDDRVRWSWVIFTAFGTPYAFNNLREVAVENWLARRDETAPETVVLRTAADASVLWWVFVALALECVGGVCAINAFPVGALSSLFASAGALVWLSFTYSRRRTKIRQLNRAARAKGTSNSK